MDLLKHSLPILQGEGIGSDNNSTRLNRKSLSLHDTAVVTDMSSAHIRQITSNNLIILHRTGLKVITITISLLHIKLLQRDP
jgi:hypothetical protein